MSDAENYTTKISFKSFTTLDHGRILKSSAPLLAKDTIYATGYLDHSYIPALDWRPLSETEYGYMVEDTFSRTDRSICIVKFPTVQAHALAKAAYRAHKDPEHKNQVRDLFLETVQSQIEIQGEISYLGVETTFDSAPTLTWENDGRRTGLHVDSWHGAKISDRDKSPNRMCLNISTTDRYLLIVNKTIKRIQQELTSRSLIHKNDAENVTSLTTAYLENNPQEPIYAIRTRPGEAYIAPTENLIHDGFVPNRIQNSSISIMGYIRPKS